MNNDSFQAQFWTHFEELRRAFIKAFCVISLGMATCLGFQAQLIELLTYPLRQAEPAAQLAILSPIEGFMTALKVCFWGSLIGTLPGWILPLIQFVLPGLKPREKAWLLPFLIGSFISIGMGIGIAYFFTLPLANAYFYNYNHSLGINLWSLSAYLDFSLLILFGHALVFESALILLLLVYTGLIDPEIMSKNRRLVYVCAFIVGALVTPPDILSQLLVAIPLVGIYEVSLGYARLKTRLS